MQFVAAANALHTAHKAGTVGTVAAGLVYTAAKERAEGYAHQKLEQVKDYVLETSSHGLKSLLRETLSKPQLEANRLRRQRNQDMVAYKRSATTGGYRKALRSSAPAPRLRRIQKRKYRRANTRTGGVIGRFNPVRGAGTFKFHDVTQNYGVTDAIQLTDGVSYGDLITIPQGNSPTERLGSGCVLRNIYMQGTLTFNPVATDQSSDALYLWIILDSQCNGVYPAPAEVFSSTAPERAFMNLNNSQRFRVLKRLTVPIHSFVAKHDNIDQTDLTETKYPIRFYMPCKIPIQWKTTDTTGVVANRTDYNVFAAMSRISSQGDMNLNVAWRFRYEDMP